MYTTSCEESSEIEEVKLTEQIEDKDNKEEKRVISVITRGEIGQNNTSSLVFISSLLGLVNRDQPLLFMHSGGFYSQYIEEIEALGYEFTPVTVDDINHKFLGFAKGYVLVDDDFKNTYIAATLAGAHDLVILTSALAEKAPYKTLTLRFDVRDTNVYNEKWLVDYIQTVPHLFNLTAIVNTQNFPFTMIDFAIANKYLMCSNTPSDGVQLARLYNMLKPNSARYGWGVPMQDEREHVQFAAKNNGLYTVPGLNTFGLSLFSSKEFKTITPSEKTFSIPDKKNAHYVTITFSDGDNTSYMLNTYIKDTYLKHPSINEIPISWMYPPTISHHMKPVHNWYQKYLPESHSYIAALSGAGYTFLTHHQHVTDYLKLTNQMCKENMLKYMVLMDDAAIFNGDSEQSFQSFMKDKMQYIPDVKGYLYANYHGYARWKGDCFFVDDIPFVSFRYRMADVNNVIDQPNTLNDIAEAINKASRNTSSIDAYSAIIVQVNPGLNYNDVMALRDKLADDVVIVNTDQFLELIKKNIAH